ncbi:MAG: hypothetical protein GX491_20200 [Chloroflexi bacterium]|nr:hypothetical protein [Chloroflexota bacterium]
MDMPVIKRYSNRKLYDTESKRYVTLEDVAEFIRRGEDVRVVDHVSGEDLTSATLLQIIFEEERKIGGLLPQVFLTRLIRTGGNTVNALRSLLVAMDPFQTVDEEIRRRIQSLVEQEKLTAEEAQRWQELLLRRAPQADVVRMPASEEAAPESEPEPEPEADFVDPQAFDQLQQQVEMLEQELARLQAGSQAAG